MPTADFPSLYQADQLRAMAEAAVNLLTTHLRGAVAGKPAVSPAIEPDDAAARWRDTSRVADADTAGALHSLLERVLADSAALHNPGWVGHQVAPPLPAAIVADLVAGYLNNGMAIYDVGPAATAIERATIRWMADKLAMPPTADGVMTSGGTLANLTALLALRQRASGREAWREGASAMTVLASAQAHYSIDRAVRVMGWGAQGVTPVETDEQLRMKPEALPVALAQAREKSRKVVGVVASACNTPVGSFDPIEPIADFCEREGLLLHVDGAHGAAAALSPRYAHLIKGIERADSVVWDAHKLLLTPATTSAVIYRDGDLGYEAFPQDASYLFEGAGAQEWWQIGRRTLECTKRMSALRLYLPLKLYGEGVFQAYVERQFDLAREFAAMLAADDDFTRFSQPESNIVCFRFAPVGSLLNAAALDALQDAIRNAVNRQGDFYITRTRLPSGVHLRTTLMHPLTTADDLSNLMKVIRQAARALS